MKTELEEKDVDAIAQKVAELIVNKLPDFGRVETESAVMDVEGLAQYLKVGKQWVYGRVHQNTIPHCKVGKYPRFIRASIDDWLGTMARGNGKTSLQPVRRLLG